MIEDSSDQHFRDEFDRITTTSLSDLEISDEIQILQAPTPPWIQAASGVPLRKPTH